MRYKTITDFPANRLSRTNYNQQKMEHDFEVQI